MPRKWNKPVYNFHHPNFMQISESHCGPAVIQMLLSNLGIEVTQEAIAEAGGAKQLIELNGMRVDQLALAVHKLAPQVKFWYKDHSRMRELIHLVNKYRFPVGVEWQGVFDDDEEDENGADGTSDSETQDSDYGHFSIITQADRKKKELIIVDPYKDYIAQDRIFSFDEFKERWWDFNEITDTDTGKTHLVEDYHMMFIITLEEAEFPLELEMRMA
jgi:hypothetical protein